MIDKSKVAILSTVMNFGLYKKSSVLFPSGIRKYVIDGREGMYSIKSLCYMMKKLKNRQIEWLIMADEDIIFVNPEAVYPIISEMQDKKMLFCGVRDGGSINHRTFNPHVINTFFSILNFKEIEKIWDKKEMLSQQYTAGNEFGDALEKLKYQYDVDSLYEPYYCFYLWLRRKSPNAALFLDSSGLPDDEIANAVHGADGKIMLYHTWYSRVYGLFEKHTLRINKIFNSIPPHEAVYEEPVMFKDPLFAFRKLLKRIYNKAVSILFPNDSSKRF